MNKYIVRTSLTAVLALVSTLSFAEDIELYLSEKVRQAGEGTKVLIIFDNSGSMDTEHAVGAAFDKDLTYPPEGSAHAYNDDALYFNMEGSDGSSEIPSSPSDARRFIASINGCETSKAILAEYGYYTGRIREYTFHGNTGSWGILPDNNGLNIEVIDCEDDAYITDAEDNVLQAGSLINADDLPQGYPVDAKGTKQNPVYHDVAAETTNVDWGSGPFVTLYTAKYLRWYHGQSVDETTESRMQTAQTSISSVINTTPSVDFGLETFNLNNWRDKDEDANGGRIVLGIKDMTDTNKAEILDIINNRLFPRGATPLCESLYEAKRYFAGEQIHFGDDDVEHYKKTGPGGYEYYGNVPPYDTDIVDDDDKYISPFNKCASNVAHVILITDGSPVKDNEADHLIETMTTQVQSFDEDDKAILDADGKPVYETKTFDEDHFVVDGSSDENKNSYLPGLAGWMSSYDVNVDIAGTQTIITHTIGFSSGADDAKDLLLETATRGQGQYHTAQSGSQLTQALISILNRIPSSNERLTSAAVAANTSDRNQNLDSVYYAMFEPQVGARWKGNLKKYKIKGGELTGIGGAKAICEENGARAFCEDTQSYWSSEVDGDSVSKGGVVGWFNSKLPSDRTLFMDGGTGNLITFNRSNLQAAFTDQSGLANEFGVAGLVNGEGESIESDAIDEMIAWASGTDVDDDNQNDLTTDIRSDVFGDPLHSKPTVINYGDGYGVRIIVGTNAGALHMFEDQGDSVIENWAFMPKEFVKNIKPLRDNYSSAKKVYGIDGEIAVYTNDINADGIISGYDKAWIFFGLRRGGSSYYALDISTPNSPKLLWHIDDSTTGFHNLGQSWSKPKVAYSAFNASATSAAPVVFISGGYDTNKDSSDTGDTKGKAIYMLNAETGYMLWGASDSGGTGMMTYPFTDSIVAPAGGVDGDSNGLIDRLYLADTGGHIWRVDMPGSTHSTVSIFELASLGGGDNKQRFFYEPEIVQTFISELIEVTVDDPETPDDESKSSYQEIPYDAILVGSGNRPNPLSTDTTDTLYMIKDSNIITQQFFSLTEPKFPDVINKTDLYDYTENPFAATMTDAQKNDLSINVAKKSGWFIDLEGSGEKTTASSLVINGAAYFTTFTPAGSAAGGESCQPAKGEGALYIVDLALGIKKHYFTPSEDDERKVDIIPGWISEPTISVIKETGDDGGDDGGGEDDKPQSYLIIEDEVEKMPDVYGTKRTFLYTQESQ